MCHPQGAGVKALMSHSWYVWSFNFRNVRVYTAESVWRAKVEEASKAMQELQATKQAMEAQIQQVRVGSVRPGTDAQICTGQCF